jgi:hypothetical protein
MYTCFSNKILQNKEKSLHFSTQGAPSNNEALELIFSKKRDLKFSLNQISDKPDAAIILLLKRMRILNLFSELVRNRQD